MKKKHAGFKDLSEKFAKDNVEGQPSPDKKLEHRKSKPSPRKMKLNTDETIKKYAHTFAKEAASPSVKSNPDLGIDVKPLKEKK